MPTISELGFTLNRRVTAPLNRVDQPDTTAVIGLAEVNQAIPDTSIETEKIRNIIGTSGAQIRFFPEAIYGMTAEDASGTKIFYIVVDGDDVGDVVMGDISQNQYAQWDESTSQFKVNGVPVGVNSFFGDGSDGALEVTSGTTTLTTDKVYQYTNINIASGATLTVAGDLIGNPLFLKCQGNCTIEGKIDLKSMGASGAAGAYLNGNNVTALGSGGVNGVKQGYDFLTTHNGLGGTASLSTAGAAGGGGGGSATAGTAGDNAGSGVGGDGGIAWTAASSQLDDDYINYKGILAYGIGSGGGGGGIYHSGGPTVGEGTGGAGGDGGGTIIIEVGGALDFDAGGEIDVTGDDGGNASIITNATGGTGAGGGGGGAGGTALIVYNTLTDNSGTMTVAVTTGGAGAGSGTYAVGRGGSAGNSLVMQNINLS